jgi:hypothetical protein
MVRGWGEGMCFADISDTRTVTEMNRTRLILFGMNNRMLGTHVSLMHGTGSRTSTGTRMSVTQVVGLSEVRQKRLRQGPSK